MLLPFIGLLIGVIIGFRYPLHIPVAYAKYMSVGVLAALDSVFGGLRAVMEEKFDQKIFVTGFVGNTLMAGVLAYIGDQLGVELYMAAVFVFGVRLFQNLGIIRRHLIKK
ncbi:MAG: small basic family protein [Bacillota bacterium]